MLALIVTACLQTNPGQCEEHVIRWTDSGTSEACKSEGAPLVADWATRNPEFSVSAARCVYMKRRSAAPLAVSE